MLLELVEYHWVEHIDDALLLLGRLDTKTVPLAGGTYLLGLQDKSIQAVVDLRDLNLAYISEERQGVRLGAMTTLQSMVDSPVLKKFAGGILSRAAQVSSSSRLIRNCATVGGTLGAGASSQADLLTALVALDAQAVVRSSSKSQVNLSGGTASRPGLSLSGVVFKGNQVRDIPCESFSMDRRPNELAIEVKVPPVVAGCGTALMRSGRTPSDEALLNVVVVIEIEDGRYRRVRVACGGMNMEPLRLQAIERQLEGQPASKSNNNQQLFAAVRAGIAEFRPPSDAWASNGYRRVSGANMIYRALEEAASLAQWRGVVSSEKGEE